MSEAKFTKAPWKFNAHDGSITDCTKAENEIATVQLEGWHHLGMGYSNAHLIVAAPEMYNLLERLTSHDNCKKDIIHLLGEADNLLAKARGEHD